MDYIEGLRGASKRRQRNCRAARCWTASLCPTPWASWRRSRGWLSRTLRGSLRRLRERGWIELHHALLALLAALGSAMAAPPQ